MEGLQLNPNFESIGKQFVLHYYQCFSSNRASLANMYGPQSMLTFEDRQFQGSQSILEKLTSLPEQVEHRVITCDCQPTPNNGIVVFVAGDLSVDKNSPMKFAQTFHLIPSGASYMIFNDLFRFCIG